MTSTLARSTVRVGKAVAEVAGFVNAVRDGRVAPSRSSRRCGRRWAIRICRWPTRCRTPKAACSGSAAPGPRSRAGGTEPGDPLRWPDAGDRRARAAHGGPAGDAGRGAPPRSAPPLARSPLCTGVHPRARKMLAPAGPSVRPRTRHRGPPRRQVVGSIPTGGSLPAGRRLHRSAVPPRVVMRSGRRRCELLSWFVGCRFIPPGGGRGDGVGVTMSVVGRVAAAWAADGGRGG